MKTKKGFKYYLTFYSIATFIYAIYMVFTTRNEGGIQAIHIIMVFLVPAFFVLFLVLFDFITEKLIPNKKQSKDDEYTGYLNKVTTEVNNQLQLGIEDFKRLRDNDKFQKALFHCYNITKVGETQDINFAFIEKKFKKDTNEYNAINIVIEEVKKMIGN